MAPSLIASDERKAALSDVARGKGTMTMSQTNLVFGDCGNGIGRSGDACGADR